MENVITDKRGLILILVVATVFIFIGLVWGISTYLPLNLFGIPSPSSTIVAPVVGKNCTYPVSYWQNHPEFYPSQLVIGRQVYKEKDILGIFLDGTRDPSVQLQAQLIGAYMNFLYGADQSYIETTIFEAYGWLVQHPAGSALTDGERDAGIRLYNLLEAYNLGSTGVAACEPGLTLTLTEASTATETPTILLTMTPSETETSTPSETPTPTELTMTATYYIINPTRTATQIIVPTSQVPTNTPVQPTEAPTATKIPPPPDTPTFTPPPPPTPTYTPPPLPSPTFTNPPPPE
jgi:hypothetical protein